MAISPELLMPDGTAGSPEVIQTPPNPEPQDPFTQGTRRGFRSALGSALTGIGNRLQGTEGRQIPQELLQNAVGLTPERLRVLQAERGGRESMYSVKPEVVESIENADRYASQVEAKMMLDTRFREMFNSFSPEEQAAERKRIMRVAFNILLGSHSAPNPELAVQEAINTLDSKKYRKFVNMEERTDLLGLGEGSLNKIGYELIAPEGRRMYSHEYVWPQEAKEKVAFMRHMMNVIDDNFASEDPAHAVMINELNAVIPYFKRSVEWRELGDVMFEEFRKRFDFLKSYIKYALSTDNDEVLGGVASVYNNIYTVLLRDSEHGYDKGKDAQGNHLGPAARSNLYSSTVMRWFINHAEEALRTGETEEEPLRDRVREMLRQKYGQEITEEAIDSSILLGERMWEISLIRAKQDQITDSSGRIYRISPYKNEQGEWVTPSEEERRAEKARLYKDLKAKRNAAFLSQPARNGNVAARNIGKMWLYTQVTSWNLKMELVDGVDFNFRDLFSLIPGDLHTYLRTKSLFSNYLKQKFVPASEKDEDIQKAEKAQVNFAADIVKAITGVEPKLNARTGRYAFDDKSEGDDDGLATVDTSKMIYNIKDLNRLKQEGVIKESEYNERVKILREIITINTDQEGNIIDIAAKQGENAEETAALQTIFKDVFANGNLFDFKWLDEPKARISRYMKIADTVKAKFNEAYTGYGRDPNPQNMVEFCKSFDGMRVGQFLRQMVVIDKFIEYQKANGGVINDPRAIDNFSGRTAVGLNFDEEQKKTLNERLKKSFPYTPMQRFFSYYPLHTMIFDFFQRVALGIAQAGLK